MEVNESVHFKQFG